MVVAPKKAVNPYKLPSNSKLKKTVVRIIALRSRGMNNIEIGEMMGLSVNTVRGYLYKAGRNGWLEDLDDPTDRLEHDVLHKVVRNMSEALDSPDEARRDDMTIKVAGGTIFKRFDPQQASVAPSLTMLSVRIEHVEGGTTNVRAGAIAGKPAYIEGAIDGDVVDVA